MFNDIDIRGSVSKDFVYVSQICEVILLVVYSKNKDQCCNLFISKGINIVFFFQEIGEVVKNVGLFGIIKNDVFMLSGVGVNFFIILLILLVNSKYLCMFIN